MFFLMLACSAKLTPIQKLTPENREAVVQAHVKRATAMWEESASDAQTLEEMVKTFTEEPTVEKLELSRDLWRKSRWSYSQTEVLRYQNGPVDHPENGVEHELNSWPLDEAFIDGTIDNPESGIINDLAHFPSLSIETLRAQNASSGEESISTGFHAIEFLLWGQDLSEAGPGERPLTDFTEAVNADRRKAYLTLSSDLLTQQLQGLAADWREGHGANYLQRSAEDNLAGIWKGLVMLSGDEMAGERMAVALETQDQEDEQSCFSDNTLADLKANLLGIKRVYSGDEYGPGLLAVLKPSQPEVSLAVQGKIDTCSQYLGLIPEPFDQSIQAPPESDANRSIEDGIVCLEDLSADLARAARSIGLNVQSITGE